MQRRRANQQNDVLTVSLLIDLACLHDAAGQAVQWYS